ncbi:prephenate dehydrogenase [Roseimaritima multifibrata]|uniref:Prephenate dehydrogenase n=1 Tax=Roseimaritima multifibrata TaxID=1930274 RepID=A0A517MK88_9BACT|nr:prephenate dehydrogenase/arogenate dehydrogenase family protein [Roseimaritima multifibrata]QDS95309.1 prephenate dehydrogenase [Roseimaritima multifibrata]
MSCSTSPLFPPRNIAIVGVGLLGGSLGMAIRRQWPDAVVTGVSRSEKNQRISVESGCVTRSVADPLAAAADADLVIICTPVGTVAPLAIEIAKTAGPGVTITDVGSTKAQIVQDVEQDQTAAGRFVGSHPIAGGEKSGPEHSRSDLFNNKTVIVTPTENSDPARLQLIGQFWQAVGAKVVSMSPALHDQRLAGISHATHFTACAVASILQQEEILLAGSGWRDTTRVASGDPQMWSDIAFQNAGPIAEKLRAIAAQITEYAQTIENRDQTQLRQLLNEAKQLRDSYSHRQTPTT